MPRTFVARDLHLVPGQPFSVSLHPGVEPIEVRSTSGDVEVCQASMEGGAAGIDGQSWPSYAHFDGCLLPDEEGLVVLPSIVLPSFHVAFLVHGRDDATVDVRTLRITYVPGDGYFGFSAPVFTRRRPDVTFSVTPRTDHSVAVETSARHRHAGAGSPGRRSSPAGAGHRSGRGGGAAVRAGRARPARDPAARRRARWWRARAVVRPLGVTVSGRTRARGRSRRRGRSTTRRARARRSRAPRSTPARRNLALISVRISSPAANSTSRSRGRRLRRSVRAVERRQHLDPLVVGVAPGDVVEGVGIEVGAELAVEHAQHVAVELGGHAGGVVVGGDEPVDVLHEVGAEEERVAGLEGRRRRRRGTALVGSGARLPMVPPRNATRRVPPPGSSSRWCSKSPTTACTSMPGYSPAIGERGVAQRRLAHVERHEAPERAGGAQRVEQEAGLLRRAGAELDERVGLRELGDLVERARRGSSARSGSGSTRGAG